MNATLIDRRFWGDAVIGAAGQMAKSTATGPIATSVAGHTIVWTDDRAPVASKPAPMVKAKARPMYFVKAAPPEPKPKPKAVAQRLVTPAKVSPVTGILRKAQKMAAPMRKARRGCNLTRLLGEMKTAQHLRTQALMTKSQGTELWAFGGFGAFA